MKNELIITDDVSEESLQKIIDDAQRFFNQYLKTKVVKTDIGYDIVSEDGEYELGSYGIRSCEYIKWIYGTGCAEPRLSRVLKSIDIKRN